MKVAIAFFITLIAVFTIVFVLYENDYKITNYPPSSGPIVAFGDSLVYGVGAERQEGFVGPLSQKLGKDIANLGVPGDTTHDGLTRLSDVTSRNPSVVFVLLGGNDRLKQYSQEETILNLREIITILQSKGAMVVLLGVKGNFFSKRFDSELEALARETGAVFVPDVLDGIFGNADLMFDSIHPNERGYRMIAEKVYEEVGEYVK